MPDIERANNALKEGQVMIVSIMGTPGDGRDLIQDYADCARMAKEAGAKIIEANYSCPNVCTGEGTLYKDPETSSKISKAIRAVIGDTPFLIKMGLMDSYDELKKVVEANLPFIDGVAGINTIAMNVRTPDGNQALPGPNRLQSGLCGSAIHDGGQLFTEQLAQIRTETKSDFVICGVGGMMTAEDLQARLDAGADIVMSATAAMWNPNLAREFRNM
jgi:dihydroorotate dehydrogenase